LWQETEYKVKVIVKAWKEPGISIFRVLTDNDRSFELFYDEVDDEWVAVELNQKAENNEI